MKKTETEEIIRTEEVTTHLFCDTCNQEIPHLTAYFHVLVSHQLWNGDCEPGEYELCSYDCLLKHQERFYRKPKVSVEYDIGYFQFKRQA